MSDYPIHPLADIFPKVSDTDYAALVESIRQQGLLFPIMLFDGQILDGRHRYNACQDAGVEPRFETYAGDDPVGFVGTANSQRRDLTQGQRGLIAAKLATAKHGRPEKVAPGDLLQMLADTAATQNVSIGTAKRGSQVVNNGLQELTQAVEDAVVSLKDAAYIVPKAKKPRQKAALRMVVDGDAKTLKQALSRIEREAEAKAAKQAVEAAPPDVSGIRVCSCKDMAEHIEPGSLDAIFTDPPYLAEYLPAYGDLADLAVHALRPGGLLLTLAGQMHLPDTIAQLNRDGLKWRWQVAYIYTSPQANYHAAKVSCGWKPLLAFTREGGHPQHYSEDTFRAAPHTSATKADHEWGQSAQDMEAIATEWLRPGWRVCDPFVGAGALLVAARNVGCEVVGCDIEPAHVATAREKLA